VASKSDAAVDRTLDVISVDIQIQQEAIELKILGGKYVEILFFKKTLKTTFLEK
jgi:hypothetical protein